MAGWGIQDNKPVATLQWFYKQYIDYAACRAKLTPANFKLLSNDTFCTIDVQSELSYVFYQFNTSCFDASNKNCSQRDYSVLRISAYEYQPDTERNN